MALLLTTLVAAGPPPPGEDPTCRQHDVEVDLLTGGTGTVAAWLCGDPAATTVQVTVPGTTYTHLYWDFPFEPYTYSYVRHARQRGYAVLNYDRIGTGASTIPAAVHVTYDMHVDVLHQLVRHLREGRIGGIAFDRVVTVGHSQGAFIAAGEAQRHDDVDAVVSTGILHGVNPLVGPHAVNLFFPAQADPELGDEAPLGYATTRPGTREPAFYHSSGADPAVIAVDEATKTVASYGELTMATALQPYFGIQEPVLSVVGERDALFCPLGGCGTNPLLPTAEALQWPEAACFDLVFREETGHDLNLHRNAPETFALVSDWLDRRLGGPDGWGATAPC